ncbi:exodeoxyribonuclease VII large subunit [Ursidibacter maritimus]|uniref:Exodeoxyribonuclease 7 large subunit n=1 Tax=Ursidibacter maritimus TaxID=1331689 RepID=A0A949T7Q5_9PAST|nr:exodeoxyribonuclease VII large subunit [Ursidibacter maritimus]KAE9539186.1 exodeoxyribonuclease VII large subunit [Ursidibacter maritimus]MBV6523941.1 exodeoxyribonuclease VII large subunit [Ursidibacter maritimus]MBV6525488.1 exodeoxyribonuclease VII large subunit [Ursidibacter maritimus]MBV6526958.1 exodeoxyribonuclease VII large subunit [Ursidibacter maritimus]MBV6530231.1 exodeoxyribonuclease VII large subunit [Ursidibacter maritimus]
MQNNVLTVTQLNYAVRHTLETEFSYIWLVGEISNFSQPVSGHWYLTLKDEQAQVRCAMFRMKNQRVNFQPRNGMQVLVRANVSLYEPRGDYQVLIETMQLAGDGLLQQQFEQLKMKLAAEGLFAQEHKKPLPNYVKTVGIITSSSGAALQDILNILGRRDPTLQVVIYPTMVQGKEATADIVQMIKLANLREECDVLIVGRGGGSLEDLWCFNEESVAWAIYHSDIPIISAVGHETDVTIADFVADIRAPTPSAAAELVSRDQQERKRQLQHYQDRVNLAFDRLWSDNLRKFAYLRSRLMAQHPKKQIQLRQQQLLGFQHRIVQTIRMRLFQQQQTLKQFVQRVYLQHPQKQLERQQQQLNLLHKQLVQNMEQRFLAKQQTFKNVAQRLKHNPLPHSIRQQQHQWGKLEQRLIFAIRRKATLSEQHFQQLCVKLEGLSPLRVLARGYSVTQNQQGIALISTQHINVGDILHTRLEQGSIVSEVLSIEE